jgi:hypothetical protein
MNQNRALSHLFSCASKIPFFVVNKWNAAGLLLSKMNGFINGQDLSTRVSLVYPTWNTLLKIGEIVLFPQKDIKNAKLWQSDWLELKAEFI